MNVEKLQQAIRASGLDGWLFFDHHRRDPIAYRILGISGDAEATRRWYCLVPAHGEPRKLVHRIESRVLDGLPGEKQVYSSWEEQHSKLGRMLKDCARLAMQYSSNCAIPYVSLVDAGTLELVRGFGPEVVSSANLVQEFEARWTEEQLQLHLEAGERVDKIRREAFDLIGERLRSDEPVTDFEIQQFILLRFAQTGLTTSHGPIVASNENASDPHYEPASATARRLQPGDLVLIDLWAKLTDSQAVYYDVTWTCYCGESIPAQMQSVFEIVRDARRRATAFVLERVAAPRVFAGYEVDDVARAYIVDRGFGDFFFHRTGHSIGTDVHGTGANMDNLESHDDRVVLAGTCFSIEPGIYLPEFGIRSEINVYVGERSARVTGEEQEQLLRI
ncbi:MAG TPA: Xaa-Pro peptidase family protein [Bryobacteraceae bacterium]|jgi:Xaa-Pro aminopeptidase|nr:Xaa-Pro peptidase family protein [Bryobacteraceae bacterium]